MRHYKTLIILALAVLLILPLSVGLAQEDEGDDQFIRGVGADVITWNPALASDTSSTAGSIWLFRSLIQLEPFTGEWVPDVATGWDVSDDGLVYTVYMRDDIFWSDGEPLDAYDVKFTYDATMAPGTETVRKSDFETVESVEVIDDYTVQFVFKAPDCNALQAIALTILPEHKFAADFSDFMTNPFNYGPDVTAGPYALEEWKPDDYIAYLPNENYVETYPAEYTGPPNIDRLFHRIIPNSSGITQALRAEEIHYSGIEATQWNDLVDEPHLDLVEIQNDIGITYFRFNIADPTDPRDGLDEEGNHIDQGQHPLFGDKRVRQALAYGWDKATAVDIILDGHGQRIYSTVAPSITWAYNADLEPYPYDPEKAAELLEEAGWADTDGDGILDKDGVKFSFTLVTNTGGDVREQLALLAQDQWEDLGVEAKVELMEWGSLIELLDSETFDMIVMGFSGGAPDPDGFAHALLSAENDTPGFAFNAGSFYDAELEQLLDEALFMPGCAIEDRAPLYHRIQEIIHEEVPMDFIYNPFSLLAMNKSVEGWDAEAAWNFWYNFAHWNVRSME